MDFFPNSIDRVTGRLAELVKLLPPVYDDDPRNFDTIVHQEPGSAVRSHLIRTGDWVIKSEDSVPADVLAPRNVSVPVEKQNAKRRQWPRAGASGSVGSIGSLKGFIRAGSFMLIVCMNWLYL